MIQSTPKFRLLAGAAATLTLHAGAGLWLFSPSAVVKPPVIEELEIAISMVSAPAPVPAPTPSPPAPANPIAPPPVMTLPAPTITQVKARANPVVAAPAPALVAAAQPEVSPAPAEPTTTPTHAPTPAETPPPSEPNFDAAYLQNPAPAYPPLSKRLREQGKVVLRVHVCADGKADDVQVQRSSGYSRLDDAALNTVRRWRFNPARQGDKAVAAWVIVPVNFNLES